MFKSVVRRVRIGKPLENWQSTEHLMEDSLCFLRGPKQLDRLRQNLSHNNSKLTLEKKEGQSEHLLPRLQLWLDWTAEISGGISGNGHRLRCLSGEHRLF